MRLIVFLLLFIITYLNSITSFAEESPHNNHPIVLQLNWLHQFQFAGYYAALDQGYFSDEDLHVVLKEGGPGINSVSEVLQKKAHYGIGSGGLLYRRLQNKPVVVVASIFQHSAAALAVAKASDINTPHDLVGKQVNMLVGGKPIVEIAAMLEYEGIALDKVRLGENKLIVESETYDNVEFIYLTNSPYFIEKNHQQVHFIKPVTYGIDFYGDALFTTESEIKEHPDRVKKMRRAIIKGWRYALQNPDEIIQKMQANYSIRHTSEHLKYEASIIQQLILPNVVEVGHSNASRWKRMADTMIRLNIVSSSEHFDGFIYQPDDEKETSANANTNVIWGILGFILALVCIVSLVSIAFFFINRQLKKRIALKTAQLQQYNDELEHTVSLRTQELHLEIKKQQQATLDAKKANQAKGKFLASMSHEIRTPLNAVVGSYFLLMRTPLDTQQKEHLQQIYTSSQSLCHIIDDILDFSKAEAGTLAFKAAHFNLAKLTQQLQQNFVTEINHKNIALNIHIDPHIPKQLNGFKQRLMQVLNNLLSNAIKFSPENAIIALHIDRQNEDSANKQHILRFKVIDNGIGIEQHDIKQLFKPFSQINNAFSQNHTGTGLGLSIAQNLVNVMGGELHCHSVIHQGSTFSFSIPLNEREVVDNSKTDKLASLHLLIVDDNKLNLFIAEAFIKPYVAKITTASSGKEALTLCHKKNVAMVLMDIQMPEMDGYQTTYHIRQNKALSYLPVIAMTANIAPEGYEESLAAGMNDHITKPLDPDVLLAVLHKWS